MKDISKYITPNLDRILATVGWIRPNEAVLYYRKNDDPKYNYKVTFACDSFYIMETWFEKHKDKIENNYIINAFENYYTNTFTTDKVLDDVILALTADFFWYEGNDELHNKYKKLYEESTGKPY